MEISETIQTIMRLCAWNSREIICKPEYRAIVNNYSSNKNGRGRGGGGADLLSLLWVRPCLITEN